MDQGQLVIEEIDAGAERARRLEAYVPAKAAFWVKGSDEGRWFLYLASDQITDKNVDLAYGEVLRLAEQMASPHLDPFLVKLIPTSKPSAQAALEIHRRFPGKMATHYGGTRFSGIGVDGVYVYPTSLVTLAPQKA